MLIASPLLLLLTQAWKSELPPPKSTTHSAVVPMTCLIQRLVAESQQMAAAPLSTSPVAQNHEPWHKGVKCVMAVTGFWGDIKAL